MPGSPDGAMVDWPGVPLVLLKHHGGFVVYAEVGRRGDYCPDEDDDLAELIEADLAQMALEYREPEETAWISTIDDGDLARTCGHVAAMAAIVAQQLHASTAQL